MVIKKFCMAALMLFVFASCAWGYDEADTVLFGDIDLESEIEAIWGKDVFTSTDTDMIQDTHIDWGSGANQVDTDDIPEGSSNLWSNLANIQAACTNDFHNIGGTDDDVPEPGDFGAATDLDANGALNTDSVSANELDASGVSNELEAVLDLQNLQGAVTDGQVPDDITITETDPIVGAITGLVKADGGGNISAATANTDYEPALTNEASLYSTLSDVTQFYEAGDKVGDADTLDTHDSSYFAVSGGAEHDNFSDFVANEHIDWTQDQGATNIHAGNYEDTDTNLTEEEVEDFVGGMLGGTETGISVTYQDVTGDIDFVVSLGTDIDSTEIAAATLVTEAEGIAGSDNDTTIPTSAAVKDYADTNDSDTTYSAGTGLSLVGTQFSTNDGEIVHDSLSGAGTLDTEAEIEPAIDTLANLTSVQGQTISLSGGLTVESASLLNQDLTSDASPTFVTTKLSVLTDSYIPYHVSDAIGLADSPIKTDGTYLGVGVTPSSAVHFYLYDNAINTDATRYGFYSNQKKTAGATDQSDVFYGIISKVDFDQSGGEIGNMMGASFRCIGTDGSIGSGVTARNIYGEYVVGELNGATLTGSLYGSFHYADIKTGSVAGSVSGIKSYVSIASSESLSVAGNAYAAFLDLDDDDGIGGTAYMLYLNERTGVDYGIYQSGTAPNVFGGKITTTTLNTGQGDYELYAMNQDVETTDSPTFATIKLSGLTDGYIPYHVADASGLADGPIYTNGTDIGIGTSILNGIFNVKQISSDAYGIYVTGADLDVDGDETNYRLGMHIASNACDIANGVTDSGYRIGLRASAHISDADFLGTLNQHIGIAIQHGHYTGCGAGTITNDYGLKIEGLSSGSATITNYYGIYQSGADKNYFADPVGIGTNAPSSKLHAKSTSGICQIEVEATINDAYLVINSDTDEGQDSEIIFEAGGTAKGRIEYDHNPTSTSQAMKFKVADDSLTPLTLTGFGNILVGGAREPTANCNHVLVFPDNSGDPTMDTDTAGLYGKDVGGTVEMFAVDEGDTASQLTSHPEILGDSYDPRIKMTHGFRSSNPYVGWEVQGDLVSMALATQELYREVFGEDKTFVKFSQIIKKPVEDYYQRQRDAFAEDWVKANTQIVEVPAAEAFKDVEIQVPIAEVEDLDTLDINEIPPGYYLDTESGEIRKIRPGKKFTGEYKIVDGRVDPIFEQVSVTEPKIVKRLKEGITFDKKTGKLYRKVLPTTAELDAALATFEPQQLPQWITDRVSQ